MSENDDILNSSSSGGVFSILACLILNKGGIVYGCAWDGLTAKHIRIEKNEDLDMLRRSKYVQSDLNNTFHKAKKDLEDGRYVCFSGTPCQIAGLRLFLNKEYERLLCVDIICHGVPSPKMFRDNIHLIEKKKNISIKQFDFRKKPYESSLKNYNYSGYYYFFKYNKNHGKEAYIEAPSPMDFYYTSFLNGDSYNECCYECMYAQPNRSGDITIGDYRWAVYHHDDLRKKVGNRRFAVSCMLINNTKGEEVLEEIKNKIYLLPTKREWIEERNFNLIHPSERTERRDSIYKEIREHGYQYTAKKYYRTKRYLIWIEPYRTLVKIYRKIKR